MGGHRVLWAVVAAGLLALPLSAQDEPIDPAGLLDGLLGTLLGIGEVSPRALQDEVAQVGGVAFRADVPLQYLSRAELGRYLEDVLRTEYPPARANADQRALVAFDLLPPDADLRSLRTRLLAQNVVGFYDERPDRRRLYAVSEERKLTPVNQLVLSHELRHALQDQYADLHRALPPSVGDFDDRRLAFMSLLEGDATLVMERFLRGRLPGKVESEDALGDIDLGSLALLGGDLDGVPPVLQDQLVRPYLVGRDFVQKVWKRGGWDAVKQAWSTPPASTEQVLHADKFFTGERPLTVHLSYRPANGALLLEGVLGELLTRTLLGAGSDEAAAGWGGDSFAAWDVGGRTLLVWASAWDTPADAGEFLARARQQFGRYTRQDRGRFSVFVAGERRFAWGEQDGRVLLVSSDDARLLDDALRSLDSSPHRPR